MTRVSVALCTYNGQRFLEQQLQSIAAQTRLPDELLVFDDASTDGTPELLRRFAQRAAFPVHLHFNAQNAGVSANFEKAITSATGDYIALADQDDVWLPPKLERAADALGQDADLGLVFCDGDVIGEHGETLGFGLWESIGFGPAQQRELARGNSHVVLERRNVVTGAACVFRASLRRAVLPLSPLWVHDAWLAAICSVVSRLRPLGHRDLCYRRHAAQQVGVRPPRGLRPIRHAQERFRGAVRDREMDLRRSIAKLDALLERLASVAPEASAAPSVRAFEARRQHLLARLNLPHRFGPRLLSIGSELANRHYGRFSSGASSALKDLLLTFRLPGAERGG